MPSKPKQKAKSSKSGLVSQPRMVRSRPILGVLSVTLAIMAFVAIWDFELSQSVQTSTEPRMNLVGVVGAEGSFGPFTSSEWRPG